MELYKILDTDNANDFMIGQVGDILEGKINGNEVVIYSEYDPFTKKGYKDHTVILDIEDVEKISVN